jgi:chromosome segregation ATPase
VSDDPSLADLSDDEIRQAAERELDALTQQIEQRDRQQEEHRRAVDSAINSLPPIDDAIKFARYETALQNQLDRALSRLERLQRFRGGEAVALPVQVEVSVTEAPDAL